jgi:cytochrome c1
MGWAMVLLGVMPEPDPETMKKAHRAQMILYGVMIFFAVLPFIVLWLKRRGSFN